MKYIGYSFYILLFILYSALITACESKKIATYIFTENEDIKTQSSVSISTDGYIRILDVAGRVKFCSPSSEFYCVVQNQEIFFAIPRNEKSILPSWQFGTLNYKIVNNSNKEYFKSLNQLDAIQDAIVIQEESENQKYNKKLLLYSRTKGLMGIYYEYQDKNILNRKTFYLSEEYGVGSNKYDECIIDDLYLPEERLKNYLK